MRNFILSGSSYGCSRWTSYNPWEFLWNFYVFMEFPLWNNSGQNSECVPLISGISCLSQSRFQVKSLEISATKTRMSNCQTPDCFFIVKSLFRLTDCWLEFTIHHRVCCLIPELNVDTKNLPKLGLSLKVGYPTCSGC